MYSNSQIWLSNFERFFMFIFYRKQSSRVTKSASRFRWLENIWKQFKKDGWRCVIFPDVISYFEKLLIIENNCNILLTVIERLVRLVLFYLLRFTNHLSSQAFKETLICGGIDHGTFQRLRGTKSYAVKAQYRHAQYTIDISTFLSPNSRKNAYAATAAVHLINACVVGISKGNKGKNPWFRTKESVSLSQAAKYEKSRNKQTYRSRNKQTRSQTLIVIFSS